MASDLRIRIVLYEHEALRCGKCLNLIKGGEALDGRFEVYIGDENEVEKAILCSPCYQAEGKEA